MLRPHLPILIIFLGGIMSHDQRILGQFLEKTFRIGAVDVEEE